MNSDTTNFGELYRAAFAEKDPDRKCVLLGEVQRVIKSWEQSEGTSAVPHLKMEAQSDCRRFDRAA
jgi:hypothetical protein